jgi:hypothetical protein
VIASGANSGRDHQRTGERLAVLGIVVPAPARRAPVRFHQQPRLAAHFAVEIFHPQRPAPLGPGGEFSLAGDEAVVGEDGDRAGKLVGPLRHGRVHAPFARLDHPNLARIVPLERAHHLAGEAARVLGIVERDIFHPPARCAQLGGEMAHGGKDQRNLLLVVPDIGRLLPYLHHQHHGVGRIGAAQAGEVGAELVAEDRDEEGAGHHRTMAGARSGA